MTAASGKYVPCGTVSFSLSFSFLFILLLFSFILFFLEKSSFFSEKSPFFSEELKKEFTLIKLSVSSSERSQNLSTVIGVFNALVLIIFWYRRCIPAEVRTLSDWKSVLSNSDRSSKKFKTCFTLLLLIFKSSDIMNSISSSICI